MDDDSNDFEENDDLYTLHMKKPINDPWFPMQNTSKLNALPNVPPSDPLRSMKSSEQYIESLEKKLKKVKGLSSKDVKPSEMIRSLETCRHLQNSQYLASNDTMNDTVTVDEVTNSMFVAMQRKLNPEKQALNPLELLPLVEDDVLSKQTETQDGNLT